MKSAAKLAGSVITGTALEARKAPSEIGLRPGGTGSGVQPMTGVQHPSDSEITDARLIQSLPQPIAAFLPMDGNTAALETRWKLYGVPDRETLTRALSVVLGAWGEPATRADTVKALTGLRAVTKARDTDEADLTFSNELMAQELADFPADVTMSAIRAMARQSTFMPSLSEIIEACHRRMGVRTQLRRTIERALTAAA